MSDVQHTFLAGTSIDYDKSLFFDILSSGYAYLGFARSEPIWGFCSLLKIRHTRTWPTDIMGSTSTSHLAPEADSAEKFYDINSKDILQSAEVPSGGDVVYISYVSKSSDETNIINHTFLDVDGIGTMTLDYMNDQWARVRGLSGDYLDYIITQYPLDEYDFYLFNYAQDITSRTRIETVDEIVRSTIEYPVRLMYSTVSNAGYPTTSFGNNLVGNLTRSINIFGETIINGLAGSFVTEGSGYIEENNLQDAIFFITNPDGIVIQDNMKYVDVYDDGDEVSVIFSYPLVGEATQNSGRLKVRNTVNPNQLVAFHEKYSSGVEVNDGNPPPLTLNFLKTGMIHSSLMDILGLKQLQSSDITFARRIDNQNTKELLISAGMSSSDWPTGNIESITVDDDENTKVEFFVTSDVSFARQYYFDLVRINISLDSSTPTSEVYRQLFVCYKPYEEDGITLCTNDTYVHDDLFDESQHQYNLGTLLYIANKVPVWRYYLDGDEEFTILI